VQIWNSSDHEILNPRIQESRSVLVQTPFEIET